METNLVDRNALQEIFPFGERLAYIRHYVHIIFYYYILFSCILNIEASLPSGVTPVTVFLSVRPYVGIRHLKKI
jgi:hypothetical protein